MRPGLKRTRTSLELDYFPAIEIAKIRYDVERKPDSGGHRVFDVAAMQHGATVRSQLVIDDDGFVVAHRLGAPVATTSTRRSQ